MSSFRFEAIGIVASPFKEKFGIPRQPGLVREARGIIRLKRTPGLREALRGLEGFSHLWVLFVFHAQPAEKWKPLVRPPRLGGVKKMGVFATRSPHRPNPIGLSVVRLLGIDAGARGGAELAIAGLDLLEGTPVLDIKPYIPYADAIPRASAGWSEIERSPRNRRVKFHARALKKTPLAPDQKKLIRQVLALDPRPAFQRGSTGAQYSMRILDFDVHWRDQGGCFEIFEVERASDG